MKALILALSIWLLGMLADALIPGPLLAGSIGELLSGPRTIDCPSIGEPRLDNGAASDPAADAQSTPDYGPILRLEAAGARAERSEPERSGRATWYGADFQGKRMANNQPFNQWDAETAASVTYPLGTVLEISYSKTITVEVRDRGELAEGQIDLSRAAFYELMRGLDAGRVPVAVRVIE